MPSVCSGASLLVYMHMNVAETVDNYPIVSGEGIERFHLRVGRNGLAGDDFLL